MNKILMSDYDQTLYTNTHSLMLNIKAIKKFRANGGKFAIVTGRNYDRIKSETEKYRIPYDYLSCVDGSVLYDKNDNVIKSYLLNKEMCETFKNKIDNKSDIEMIIMRENNVNNINNVIQCYYDVTNYDKIEMLLKTIKKELINYPNLEASVLDFGIEKLLIVTKKNVSKKTAGIDIANIENVSHSDIYCIGDHCNDIEMLEYFNGYAMKNGEEKAKRVSLGLYNNVRELIYDLSYNKILLKKRG